MRTCSSDTAVRFVTALVEGDFIGAQQLLSRSARERWSLADLESEFLSMCDYDGGALTDVQLMEGLEEWPASETTVIYRCYIALSGKSAVHAGFISEAIALVLVPEEGEWRIRDIEWGHP